MARPPTCPRSVLTESKPWGEYDWCWRKAVGRAASKTIVQPWETIVDMVRQRYTGIMERKSRELERRQYRIPWPERIWPEPVPEMALELKWK